MATVADEIGKSTQEPEAVYLFDNTFFQVESSEKVKKENDGNEKIICEICHTETTYRNFKKHTQTPHHRRLYKEKELMRKQNKKKEKKEEKKKILETKRQRSVVEPQQADFDEDKPYKEIYYIRRVESIPEHILQYIHTLTALLALRYCFSNDNFLNFFKISLNNSTCNEFGDIVFELGFNQEITTIQAIQCKQTHSRNNISLSTLSAEHGKFSIKIRCDLLKRLRKKANYDKTFFKVFTVSALALSKDTSPQIIYDELSLQDWKNPTDIATWKDREVIIPEYKAINILNTSDEPNDICYFKIINHKDRKLDDDLNKFSMFTNQKKLNGLKHLINRTVQDKFGKSRDISNDLIKYIKEYFVRSRKKGQNHYKLTKTTFLLKFTELILTPYLVFADGITEDYSLELWNKTLHTFDVVLIRNHFNVINKIYSGINTILKHETQFSLGDSANLKIKKREVTNKFLNLEIFDDGCDQCDLVLPSAYLALWKSKLTPLVLLAPDHEALSLIAEVISFLEEENIRVKFIVATNDFDRATIPKNLDAFFSLEDLKGRNDEVLEDIKKTEIAVLDFTVSLKQILEWNRDFMKKITPEVLLNMFLKDFSFKDFYVPMTESIIEDTLVLDDDDIAKVARYFQKTDVEAESVNLSYLVNFEGKVAHIHVPPEI